MRGGGSSRGGAAAMAAGAGARPGPGGEQEERPVRGLDRRLVLRLWPYFRPHAARMTMALAMLPVLAALDLAKPYLLKIVIDEHLVPGRAEGLPLLALAYMAILAAKSCLDYLHSWITQKAGQDTLADVREAVFRRFQGFDMAHLDRNPVGALVTRATTDVEALSQMFQSGLLAILADLITMAGIVAVMASLSPRLTLCLLLVLPFAWAMTSWCQRELRASFRISRSRLAAMNAFVAEHVAGTRVVRLFGLAEAQDARYEVENRAYRDAYHRSNLFDALLYATMEFTGSVTVAVFLAAGSALVAGGVVTVGVLVAFLEYASRFFQPLRDLSSKFAVMQAALAAAEKIVAVLDREPAIRDPEDPVPLPASPRGQVEFRGVSFHYRSDQPVLSGIDLRIRPGEVVAMVGATGSGKTTLAKLLERFYDPIEGAVLLDGVDLRRVKVAELRDALSIVLQDPFLVAGTIEENLRLGHRDVSEEVMRKAAAAVEAEPFILRREGGYQARVEEGGVNLSAGEKQLLAFARTLVRDPRVLILDEATSNVDVETEARLQRAIATLTAGRTSLVIAHRLSTIRAAHRVLVMHQGRIVEQGTHAELVAAGGRYAGLYRLQERDILVETTAGAASPSDLRRATL